MIKDLYFCPRCGTLAEATDATETGQSITCRCNNCKLEFVVYPNSAPNIAA